MNKKILLAIAAALVTLALALAACSDKAADTDDSALTPNGKVTGFTGCKMFAEAATRGLVPADQDCVAWEYDGASVLKLTHVNSGFNCCPDSLSARFHISTGSIIIDEAEWLTKGCFCLCLYDLEYEIVDLPPGEYGIRINQPYLPFGATVLEFTVDLASSPTGAYCVERDYYPWGIL